MAKSTVKLPKKTKVKPPTKTIKPSNGKTKRCKKRYTKKELEEFDKIIKDKIEELQEQIEYYESLTKIPVSEQNGNPFADPVERGSDNQERRMNLFYLSREKKHQGQLEEAHLRVKKGTFGICKDTGEIIPKNRLVAVPTTQSILINGQKPNMSYKKL